jgi:hypothetical protein
MNRLKNILRRLLRPGSANVKNETLLDTVYGHSLSGYLGKPVNKDGAVTPWYTYAAIEFMDQFDLGQKTVFEWGCGNSSLFFAERAAEVTSVEHDMAWYEQMRSALKSNQELKYVTLEEYPGSIKDYGKKFDILVIDGQRRFDCVRNVASFLKEGGMVILDNSDWFYLSAAFLREELGLMQVDFHGFGPINAYTWTTSVFFGKGFRFPLKKGRQPVNPTGGLLHDERSIIENEDGIYHTTNSKWVKSNVG